MALFSRRCLQRALDESGAYLSGKERADICSLLNTVHDNYLSKEWELVITHAASKLGSLQYEPDLGGSSRPDFLFRAADSNLTFLTDITAVSDRGFEKLNPVEAMEEEFRRQLYKRKMIGGFDVRVDAYQNNVYRGSPSKPQLKLPKQSEFHSKIFNGKFHGFLDSVQKNPEERHYYHAANVDTSVHFQYEPSRRGYGGSSHLAFNFANIIDRNPVYNALASKAEQLRNASFAGMKGIILCDGGCRMLHDISGHWASYRIDEVISHFLRNHHSINFVVSLTVQQPGGGTNHGKLPEIEPKVYLNEHQEGVQSSLVQFISALCKLLPKPEFSPANALRYFKRYKGLSGRHLGGLTMGNGITMSSRKLLDLLSGVLTIEEFNKDYQMSKVENPFRRMLSQGRLITEVVVESHPESDDDRVTIKFGMPDPAISRFV